MTFGALGLSGAFHFVWHIVTGWELLRCRAMQMVEHNIAIGVVIAILVTGTIFQKNMAFQPKFRRKCSGLAPMIGLGRPLGHHHIRALLQSLRHQKFQLARLISTGRHACAIIPFDPNLNAQFF